MTSPVNDIAVNQTATEEVVERAPAKVNLWLRVTGRRANGYHELDSLVAFAGIGDTLTARPSTALSLEIVGEFAAPLLAAQPATPDNLVLRAAHALANALDRDPVASLTLEKNLPVASGIGGGSADAAAALRALQRLWNLDPLPAEVAAVGLSLGADVPVCLAGRSSRMTGIGEILQPVPGGLPSLAAVLVNPGVPVSTHTVFKALSGDYSAPPRPPDAFADAEALLTVLAQQRNDLEAPAIRLAPEIGAVLAALEACDGVRLTRMSGSGATCFGLFDTQAAAQEAAQRIRGEKPDWWVAACALGDRP